MSRRQQVAQDGDFPSDAPADSAPERLLWPVWDQDQGGPARDHVKNTEALLKYYKVQVRYNLMTHDLEVTIPGRELASERRANCTVDWVENRAAEHGLSRAPIIKHLQELASEYHPVRDWVNEKPWDGVDRVPQLMASLELAESADPDMCALLMRRWLRGAAAALWPEFEQNFAAQGVLVLQGPQGHGKTRWLQNLVTDRSWMLSGELLDPGNRDSTQRATSVWLCELGEVDATFRKADIAALKFFVTRTEDTYRLPYARRAERTVRRTVFVASVNDEQYLVDRTGNRRWWTVSIEWCHDHNVDMQQLWAQMLHEVVLEKAPWWLDESEMDRLNNANRSHEQEDVMAGVLGEYWQVLYPGAEMGDFEWRPLAKVCGVLPQFAQRLPSQAEMRRVTDALRDMGVAKKRDKFGMKYLLRRIAD